MNHCELASFNRFATLILSGESGLTCSAEPLCCSPTCAEAGTLLLQREFCLNYLIVFKGKMSSWAEYWKYSGQKKKGRKGLHIIGSQGNTSKGEMVKQ